MHVRPRVAIAIGACCVFVVGVLLMAFQDEYLTWRIRRELLSLNSVKVMLPRDEAWVVIADAAAIEEMSDAVSVESFTRWGVPVSYSVADPTSIQVDGRMSVTFIEDDMWVVQFGETGLQHECRGADSKFLDAVWNAAYASSNSVETPP